MEPGKLYRITEAALTCERFGPSNRRLAARSGYLFTADKEMARAIRKGFGAVVVTSVATGGQEVLLVKELEAADA